MSDALASQAVREDCIAVANEHVKARDVLAVLASAGVFALFLVRGGHWLWWLAGLPPLIYGLLGVVWLVAYFWFPHLARSKLAHLPNRSVKVEVSDATIAFQTATERLEVAWEELKALKRRPNFWLVCLKSGTRIPIPVQLLSPDTVSFLESKLSHGLVR